MDEREGLSCGWGVLSSRCCEGGFIQLLLGGMDVVHISWAKQTERGTGLSSADLLLLLGPRACLELTR